MSSSELSLAILVPVMVVSLIMLRGGRARRLHVRRMWLGPLLLLMALGLVFSIQSPPPPLILLLECLSALGGGAIGWWLGRATAITLDPATGHLMSKPSRLGLAVLATVVALRIILRDYAQANAAMLNIPPLEIVNLFLLMAAGLVCAQQLEMWLRAREIGRPAAPTAQVEG